MEIEIPFDERFRVLPGGVHYRDGFAHRGKHLFIHALGGQRGDLWFQDFANFSKMHSAFGWSAADQTGTGLARRGIDNLKSQGSFARMPYWLSLLADLSARDSRPGTARATLDAALVAGRVHDDVWWLPEVMRMRAAYDEEQAAVARLLAAAQLASEHGSVALLRRCERDLGTRNVRLPALSVPPMA